MLDVVVFDSVSNWAGCIAIFVLQLVFLIGMAQWLGIDWVVVWLERVLGKYLATDKDK